MNHVEDRWEETKPINTTRLRETSNGDDAFEVLLLEAYLRDGASRVVAMRKALTDKDEDAWRRAAHSLKGASATIGADAVRTIALSLEETDINDNPFGVEDVLAELEQEMEQVRVFLEQSRKLQQASTVQE